MKYANIPIQPQIPLGGADKTKAKAKAKAKKMVASPKTSFLQLLKKSVGPTKAENATKTYGYDGKEFTVDEELGGENRLLYIIGQHADKSETLSKQASKDGTNAIFKLNDAKKAAKKGEWNLAKDLASEAILHSEKAIEAANMANEQLAKAEALAKETVLNKNTWLALLKAYVYLKLSTSAKKSAVKTIHFANALIKKAEAKSTMMKKTKQSMKRAV